MLSRSRSFRRAYQSANLVVNDSRLLDNLFFQGRVLCAPGSEIAPLRLKASSGRIAIIGANTRVQEWLSKTYPDLDIVALNPTMGFIRRRRERRELASYVLALEAESVFICTGAPQSEVFAAQLVRSGCVSDILCCGSALNFLAGEKQRAPEAFRKLGAEWLWRFIGEPHTRTRYLADAGFLLKNLHLLFRLRHRKSAPFHAFNLHLC